MPATLSGRLQGPWFVPSAPEILAAFWNQTGQATGRLRQHVAFFESMAAGSDYLKDLLIGHSDTVAAWLDMQPEDILADICAQALAVGGAGDVDRAATTLRRLKPQSALLIAMCDVGRVWSLAEVMAALTRFADCAIKGAVDALLRAAHADGKLMRLDQTDPGQGSGYVVLAMGKHGACELNYSSDVDLIVFYDPDAAPLSDGVEPGRFFVRLTQRLTAMLQDVTEDGYVLRVDLRLRPDPRATQVAIAIESAASYYENMGQNWERAAYIKARPIAGDLALGEAFLRRLVPYIWRKYLDFAAIADVQSLIRQIHAVKGHGEIAVEGHNLKLGRGGIREIEFFVQTQQLIAGGRNAQLRGRRTEDMLQALSHAKWISAATAEDLSFCYGELRRLEHRAQMQDDRQLHTVPADPALFERFALFSGFSDGTSLRLHLRKILEMVRGHSARLFERATDLGGEGGALVFTGGEDDPETISTLQRMGYRQASEVSATIRGWHFGRYAATRDRRAREALTELMPNLLSALAQTGDADRAFVAFDEFMQGLPAGVQLFSMLRANPNLLALLAQVLGTAPRLAEGLSRRPRVLEAVLEPGFFGPLPTRQELRLTLAAMAPPGISLDEAMDRARVFGREQMFRVGVRVLSETVTAEDAGKGFAQLADTVIERLLEAAAEDLTRQHGLVPGGAVAVVALGKLGGQEMTAASDLDLMIVYDHEAGVEQSDGKRPLSPAQYFARLCQRLITAIAAPTAEGELYDVDMRLRPSGSKGPVAVSLPAFVAYQAQSAWTWEKLALTRARIVASDAPFAGRLQEAIRQALVMRRNGDEIRRDVLAMRGLMLREHNPKSPWDIKRFRGGLVEAEFIAQYLQLVHAAEDPAILHSNTFEAITALRDRRFLSAADAEDLLQACQLFHRLTQLIRLCVTGDFDPEAALPGLKRAVSMAAGTADIGAAEALLREHQVKVAAIFDRLIGTPEWAPNPATDFAAQTV